MNYITEIFDRLNLQQIRGFLLAGTECKISYGNYKERLEAAEEPIFKLIAESFPKWEEKDKIECEISHYGSIIRNVYMEIGMQCGAVLAMQLLSVDGSLANGKQH